MQHFIFSFNIVFPIFALILFGYFLRVKHLVNESFLSVSNKLCYKILIPLVVFRVVYQSDLSHVIEPRFVAYSVISLIIYTISLMIILPKFVTSRPKVGSMLQAMTRSNFALFGIVLAERMLDDPTVTAVLLAIIVPIFNVSAVIILSIFGDNGQVNVKSVISSVFHNPIIIAMILAFGLNFGEAALGVSLPNIIIDPLFTLATIGTPLALLSLGAGFRFRGLKEDWQLLSIAVLGKLVLMPVVILGPMILLGYRDAYLVAGLAMTATPTAVSSYILAVEMKCDGKIAGDLVVLTAALSAVTMFLYIVLMSAFNFI